MGVKDLWRLLETAGRPVSLESLEGAVLAIDVSIWLHQAVKGVRDREGGTISHAHLLVLFNRICKLLHYRIKPVFVFDGATPALKQRTLAARSQRREQASQKSLTAADKQVTKFLQAKILEQLTGEKSTAPAPVSSTQADMFELPPLPENQLNKERTPKSPSPTQGAGSLAYLGDVVAMDIHSQEFDSLPPDVQHELLLERQQVEKYSYSDPASLPQVAGDFSNYQLSRLVRRSHISQKLEGVRRSLKSSETAIVGLGEEAKVHEVESSRIMSSDSAHYILVRGTDIGSSSQDETLSQDSMELSESKEWESDLVNTQSEGESKLDAAIEPCEPSGDSVQGSVRLSHAKEIADEESGNTVALVGTETNVNEVIDLTACTSMSEVGGSASAESTASVESNASALGKNISSSSSARTNTDAGDTVTQGIKASSSSARTNTDAGDTVTQGIKASSSSARTNTDADDPVTQGIKASSSSARTNTDAGDTVTQGIKASSLSARTNTDAGDPVTQAIKASSLSARTNTDAGDTVTQAIKASSLSARTNTDAGDTVTQAIKASSLSARTNTDAGDTVTQAIKASSESSVKIIHLSEGHGEVLRTSPEVKAQPKNVATVVKSNSPSLDSQSPQDKVQVTELQVAVATKLHSKEDSSSGDAHDVTVTSFESKQTQLPLFQEEGSLATVGEEIGERLRSEGGEFEQTSSRSWIPVEAVEGGQSLTTQLREQDLAVSAGELTSGQPGEVALQTEPDVESGTESHHNADVSGIDPEPEAEWSKDLLQLLPSEAQSQLGLEARELGREGARQARAATSVTSHMYKDAMTLLSLFGLPYLTAPSEAEAQCAFLDTTGLTQGTITDDNDVFLFGGRKVYRHFFTPERHVELYSAEDVERRLGLSRDHLVTLAYLLGSDYSEGVEGVGVVSAMEILRDFPGKGIEPLKKFKEWHSEVNSTPALTMKETGQHRKLRQLCLPPPFPDPSIRVAYLSPEVDTSREPFQWGRPDLDLLRKFAFDRMGWPQGKVDATLLPVLQRMNTRETQLTLTRFLPQVPPSSQKKAIRSKRIRNVVARLTSTGASDDSNKESTAGPRPRGRRKDSGRERGRGRGRGVASAVKRKRVELSSSGSSSDAEFGETGSTCKARSAAGSGKSSKSGVVVQQRTELSSSGSSSDCESRTGETGKTSLSGRASAIKNAVSDTEKGITVAGERGVEIGLVTNSDSDSEFDHIVKELVAKEMELPGFQEVPQQSAPAGVQHSKQKAKRRPKRKRT